MKPRRVELGANDEKARGEIRRHLELGACNHTLSRKLLDRFSTAGGPVAALIPPWVNLSQIAGYNVGSVAPPHSPAYYAPGESPRDLLVEFVLAYLQTAADAVVVCENSGAARETLKIWTWSQPPRASSLGDDEIYYILQSSHADPEMIDAALSDSLGHWTAAACSSSGEIPNGDMPDDSFLDLIVENTEHILLSAFDDDGYLIWSPTVRLD
ncbi:MAG TPA: hypothetical protein VMF30_15240 [Pirellulales bacterium]|nr:hypothetical protein [Pirellulales bacterium]